MTAQPCGACGLTHPYDYCGDVELADHLLTAPHDVRKVNDPSGKHDGCRYFVLDPQDIADLRAEVDRLRARLESEAVCRRANSAQSRKLMDAIRDDPAFPPDDDPALFGDRALLVVNRLQTQVAADHSRPLATPDYRPSGAGL